MTKNQLIELQGVVTKIIPGGKYLVELENKMEVVAHPNGRMRMNKINVLVNDRVTIEMTPYDLTKGRLTYRHK
jgi:translation initiation factor IF-1